MKTFGIICMTLGALAIAPQCLPATAAAAPTGGSPAADTVKWLRDRGYNVVLNGTPNGPLSQCIVTSAHGMRDSNVDPNGRQLYPTPLTTVYVDISCNTTT